MSNKKEKFNFNKMVDLIVDITKTVMNYCKTPIHKEGYRFIVLFFGLALFLSFISGFLTKLFILLGLFCVFFFRNPERFTSEEEGIIVSPADGKVSKIEEGVSAPKELSLGNKKFTRVSIFLSVMNVHVQRVPVGGKVTKVHYREGKFLNASLDKASEDNERQCCVVETKSKKEVVFVQIAGLIARRIVCNLEEGQEVKTGDEYGIIRFGSRLDLYLPTGIKPEVLVGQTMVCGETIIARMK